MNHRRIAPALSEGFSLIELSIVLVIIGLLAGGILMGKSLLRASEIRAVTFSLGKFNSAVNLFQTEFKSLPGDMPNATSYWGAAGACPGGASTGGPTCNGDGNGQITGNEIYRAWQHLSNAQLIGDSTNGVSVSTTVNASVPDQNIPAGKVTGSGFDFWYLGLQDGSGGYFAANYGNSITFGSTNGNADIAIHPIITPTDAQSIDKKLDDGLPGSGMILSVLPGNALAPNCATIPTGGTATDATYNTSATAALCSLILITGF